MNQSTLIKKIPYSPVAPIAQCGGCGRFVPEADLFACVRGDESQGRCAGCFSDPRLIATLLLPPPTLLPDGSAELMSLERRVRAATGLSPAEIKKSPLGKRQPEPPFDHFQTTAREMSRRKKTNWTLLLCIVLTVALINVAGAWFGFTVTFMDNHDFAKQWHKLDDFFGWLQFVTHYHGE